MDGVGLPNAQVGANGGISIASRSRQTACTSTSAPPTVGRPRADNLFLAQKFDGTESETLQIGTGFGTTPSIEQGPDGNLYVVSVTTTRSKNQPQSVVPDHTRGYAKLAVSFRLLQCSPATDGGALASADAPMNQTKAGTAGCSPESCAGPEELACYALSNRRPIA
jgi:hypothetical protein